MIALYGQHKSAQRRNPNRTPIVGLKKFRFDDRRCGSFVCVRIEGDVTTHDNGTEFARRTRLRDELGMDTYFADPYSSWQRGSNENRNGIIRRCLPKRTIIEPGMARELQEIVDETDNRPMRVLGHRTPAEAFADELLNLQDKQGCCTSK